MQTSKSVMTGTKCHDTNAFLGCGPFVGRFAHDVILLKGTGFERMHECVMLANFMHNILSKVK